MATTTSAAIGCASLVVLLAACAATEPAPTPAIPESLRVTANQVLSLETRAAGVQIYECKAGNADPKRFDWVLRAPEADLYDGAGKKIGKHYAGPTWESNDGSKVVGEVRARDDGPDADAIPWLLLGAKSSSGAGVLGRTESIQRVRTAGGKAPAGGCGEAQAGRELRVPYSATYYFYVRR